MTHVDFTSPVRLLTANGGKIGIALTEGGKKIIGWVDSNVCSGSSEGLFVTSHHNQWFHVALSWYSDEVYFFFNGNLLSSCLTDSDPMTQGEKFFKETGTDLAYIIIEAPELRNVNYRLAVSFVNIWEDYIESDFNIGNVMGLSRVQASYFAQSSFYWPMTGLLTNLAPGRMTTLGTEEGGDKNSVDGGAICTDSGSESYIVLTGDYRPSGNYSNLYFSCLYNITQCQSLLFVIDFQLKEDLEIEDREIVMLKTPPQSDSVGIEITLNPFLDILSFIHRTSDQKCNFSISWTEVIGSMYSWTNLQAYMSVNSLGLRINDEAIHGQPNCVAETSEQPPFETGKFPKIVIGQDIGLCVSNVAIIEDATQLKPDSAILDDLCYSDVDTILPLDGNKSDWMGRVNKATDLSTFTALVTSKKMSNALRNFMTQCTEFTMAFWMNIKCDNVDTSSMVRSL